MDKTWLQKNIRALIALSITIFVLATFGIAFYVTLVKGMVIQQSNKDVLILILNSLSGFVGLVLGFYFGSMERDGENSLQGENFTNFDTGDCEDCS
jgi:hypothetical protein